jgi:beta-galactosidase
MRVNSGGVNIIFSDSNTHFRGAENYRRSGEVDALRIPKDAFWAHQVMWDGWVDVEKPRIHIIGHWNYAPGTKKNVYVVSSAEQVELFLNGKSLGKGKQSSRFLYTFANVEWQPGNLRAVGLSADGKTLCETEHQTADEPAAIRMTLKTGLGGLKADGADVALVEFEVIDAQGRRCPTAMKTIDFELSGPAEWRGGLAQGPNNYILSKRLPVECGVNRALIRSRPEAGRILLTAKSAGLKEASVEFMSKPIEVVNGLTKALPGHDLPCSLLRGPTPAGAGFVVSRMAVPIAGASAGTNSAFASATFDDDETTSWTNDNKIATAWIRYEFAREARPNEVTLKLNGWRQRSYPLRITMDGEEVYRGVTPRSLGYVTLPLKPVKGRSMKIELISSASVRDGFNITEVENQQNTATGGENAGNGTLGIVEFECYELAASL